MINPKELRIDNWVNWRNSFYQVENGFVLDEYTEEYTPIPLTPEILEKAGFGYSEANSVFRSGVFRKWIDVNSVALIPNADYYSLQATPLCQVRYLHQLQNLIHALTGEELNIEL